MSFDDVIELLKAIRSGNSDLASALTAPVSLLLIFALASLGTVRYLINAGLHKWAAAAFGLAVVLAGTFVVLTSGKGVPDSGAKSPSGPEQIFELHAGQVLIGGNLDGAERPIRETTIEACQKLCSASSKCQAFTFDNTEHSCFLKREASELHAFAAAVSGIRRTKR